MIYAKLSPFYFSQDVRPQVPSDKFAKELERIICEEAAIEGGLSVQSRKKEITYPKMCFTYILKTAYPKLSSGRIAEKYLGFTSKCRHTNIRYYLKTFKSLLDAKDGMITDLYYTAIKRLFLNS